MNPNGVAPGAPLGGDDGLFWEAQVALRLGVARHKLATLRAEHLREGDHYRIRSNAVVLTEPGLARLQELLAGGVGAPSGAPRPSAVTESVLAGQPERARFRVLSLPPNKRLIVATRVGEPEPGAARTLVRVRSSELFMPRMEFEAMHSTDGMWQFMGRLPRRKGRW